MAKSRIVSRSGKDEFHGLTWNAMMDLCAMEPLDQLTSVQRTAALAFWYMSEVNNGGHFQYFVNKWDHPHEDVVDALEMLNAPHSARVLAAALEHLGAVRPWEQLRDVEHYLEVQGRFDFAKFDAAWGAEGDREINRCLECFLKKHEGEFVQWVD